MLLPRDDSGKAAPSDVLNVGWGGFIRHICGQTDITEKPPYEFKALLVTQKVLSTKYSALLKKRADDTSQWYFSAPP
jgi:hypothetical protein